MGFLIKKIEDKFWLYDAKKVNENLELNKVGQLRHLYDYKIDFYYDGKWSDKFEPFGIQYKLISKWYSFTTHHDHPEILGLLQVLDNHGVKSVNIKIHDSVIYYYSAESLTMELIDESKKYNA